MLHHYFCTKNTPPYITPIVPNFQLKKVAIRKREKTGLEQTRHKIGTVNLEFPSMFT